MSWFSKIFRRTNNSSGVRQNNDPQNFPTWLHQQSDDISIQDALDKYIDTCMPIEQVDDLPQGLARQRVEIALLEQLATKYGKSASPEFNDLLFHKKIALQMCEDSFQMKCESQKAIREAMQRVAK